jgi:hypothetical protein
MGSIAYTAVAVVAIFSLQGASAQEATVCLQEDGPLGGNPCVNVPIGGCVRFTGAENIALKEFKEVGISGYKLYAHVAAKESNTYDTTFFTNDKCVSAGTDLFIAEIKKSTVLGAQGDFEAASYSVTSYGVDAYGFLTTANTMSDDFLESSSALSVSTKVSCNAATQHTCNDGSCIRLTWQCDGTWDCPMENGQQVDKSDEDGRCTTTTTTTTTTSTTTTATTSTTTTTTANMLSCEAGTWRQTVNTCDCSADDFSVFPSFKFLSMQPWIKVL